MRVRPSKHRGFTLIELLVVMAIIAVLIALLLPAVQQAREAARRSQCKNNLKQIALGLHNYHETYNTFPPNGFLAIRATDGSIFNGHSWMTMVLPFVDQRSISEKYNSDVLFSNNTTPRVPNGPTNAALAATILNVQLCPSNPTPYEELVIKTGMMPAGYIAGVAPAATMFWQGANGDYKPIAGVRGDFANNYVYGPGNPDGYASTPGVRHGALYEVHITIEEPFANLNDIPYKNRIGDIYDGTQNTILLVEDPISNVVWRLGTKCNPLNTVHLARWPDLVAGGVPGDPYGAMLVAAALGGGMWAEPGFGDIWFQGSSYNGGPWLAGGPCIMCTNEQSQGIRGFHPGGTHVALADGTVHFLSENIEQRTFGYMITRECNEPLAAF